MRKLSSYFKGYRKKAVIAPLFKCLEACFELLVPLVVAYMIDYGIGKNDVKCIGKMAGVLILLAIIGAVCSLTAQYFAAKTAVHVGSSIRKDLFGRMMKLEYEDIDQVGTSTLMTRITSDVNQVQTGINMFLRLFMRSPFIVFGSVIMAFTVDAKAALVFVVTVPVLAVIVFVIMLSTMPLYKNVQKQTDEVLSVTRENLKGTRVIRAFNRQESEKKKFAGENDKLVSMQIFVGRISALLNPLTCVVVNVAVIVLLFAGGKEVNTGMLTQGQVVALVNYMLQILTELVKLADLIILITKASACYLRVQDVLNLPLKLEKEEVGKKREGFLSFENVSFSYEKGAKESLKDVSFTIEEGETVGIIGGTGSGKTTLVNLIPRFYDVTEGRICVRGQDVKSFDVDKLRKMVGLVPQKAALFRGTIKDNLLWGKEDASLEELNEALRISQAKEFVEKSKYGLGKRIEQGGRNLSGGQKQRLSIARALVRNPKILILDDSSSALDYMTDARLRQELEESREGRTTFIVSQRVNSVQDADRILVLDAGELVGNGTHEELLKTCEVYQEICQSQLSGKEGTAYGE